MNKDRAIRILWEYLRLNHELKKADAILVFGNRNIRVAEYAAQLWLDGWAPYLVYSGCGDIHNHKPGRELFVGTTEAEVFADAAIKMGVPKESILIENKSQNTGENYEFTINLLKEKGITVKTVIVVHKPHVERRIYATGKKWLPNVDLIVTSPPTSLEDYPTNSNNIGDDWIHAMVGTVQRIKEYPSKGFQIEQDIPDEVLEAYEFLVKAGFVNRLIK